jgi:hypothetical protein
MERNMRQATRNAAAENVPDSGTIADNDEIPGLTPSLPITEVTKDNYNEVVVHIGKAEGEMLGKKIGELHPNIVDWLYTKWRNKLSPLSDDKDLQLKTAIEFSYQELHNDASKVKAIPGGDAEKKREASPPVSSSGEGLPSVAGVPPSPPQSGAAASRSKP